MGGLTGEGRVGGAAARGGVSQQVRKRRRDDRARRLPGPLENFGKVVLTARTRRRDDVTCGENGGRRRRRDVTFVFTSDKDARSSRNSFTLKVLPFT